MNFLNEIYQNVVLNPSPRSFFILAGLAVLTYRIPLIDKLLRTFYTLLHESGHAMMSLITGGKNHRMELNSNLSGLTITESRNSFFQFVVAISGYPFASAFAWLGFVLILNNATGVFHIILLVLIFVQLIFNIRNSFGIIWSIAVMILLGLEMYKMPHLMWATGVIICAVVLFESLIMAGHILFLSVSNPKMSGDANNLGRLTGIPAALWGAVFFSQAVFFVYLSFREILFWAEGF